MLSRRARPPPPWAEIRRAACRTDSNRGVDNISNPALPHHNQKLANSARDSSRAWATSRAACGRIQWPASFQPMRFRAGTIQLNAASAARASGTSRSISPGCIGLRMGMGRSPFGGRRWEPRRPPRSPRSGTRSVDCRRPARTIGPAGRPRRMQPVPGRVHVARAPCSVEIGRDPADAAHVRRVQPPGVVRSQGLRKPAWMIVVEIATHGSVKRSG